MRHLLLVTALCAASTALAPQAEAQVKVMAWGRPRIGVVVDVKPDSAQDKLGARIREVTPGGPADKAGLKAGDIVTRFNGTALGGVKSEDDDESGPGNKLIDLAHALDTGDTVKVEYRRGAETRKATLVATEMSGTELGHAYMFQGPDMHGFSYRMPAMGQMPRIMEWKGTDGPGGFRMRIGGEGLDLIDLNPDLGEYFGSKDGVLVVSAPADTTIPLKAGDVILALDGRKPRSSGHAQRILDSYEPGETIKADIMRKQKRVALTWVAPKPWSNMMWKRDGDGDEGHGEMKMRIRGPSGSANVTPAPSADRS
jgi:S1-C subfamily serine protease